MLYKLSNKEYEINIYSNPIPKKGNRGITEIADEHFIITLKRSKAKCFVGIFFAFVFYIIFVIAKHILFVVLSALILLLTFCTFCRKNTIHFIMDENNLVVKKVNGCCCCLTRKYRFGPAKLDRIDFHYSSYLKHSSKRYYRYSLEILTFKRSIKIFNIDINYPAFTEEEIQNFKSAINYHIKNNMQI